MNHKNHIAHKSKFKEKGQLALDLESSDENPVGEQKVAKVISLLNYMQEEKYRRLVELVRQSKSF